MQSGKTSVLLITVSPAPSTVPGIEHTQKNYLLNEGRKVLKELTEIVVEILPVLEKSQSKRDSQLEMDKKYTDYQSRGKNKFWKS